MVQHLLLIIAAPPLLVAARPISTLRPLLPPPAWVERASSRWWHRWGSLIAPVCFVLVLFGTHLTPVYDAALRSRLVLDGEHLAFLMAAVAIWAVVSAPVTSGALGRVLAAFAVIAGSAVLGIVLTSADRPLVDTYAERLGQAAALRDQRDAASLMWVGGMALGLPLIMTSVWRWAALEDRITRRREALQDAAGRLDTPIDTPDSAAEPNEPGGESLSRAAARRIDAPR
jgi:cytochrome c oxidase assembly factor CtaG